MDMPSEIGRSLPRTPPVFKECRMSSHLEKSVTTVWLSQDFKTGHITMSSPRSMFIAQIAGAVLGKPFGSLPYLYIGRFSYMSAYLIA